MQLTFAVGVVVIGGGFLGAEYFLVKWYPRHQQQVRDQTLNLLPYRNDALGIEMQVAAGIYGKVESFPGGVRIFRPRLLGTGPSLTVTTQPNPERAAECFGIVRPGRIGGRRQAVERGGEGGRRGVDGKVRAVDAAKLFDARVHAVLIWQSQNRSLALTARVISPERIVQVDCSPGGENEALFIQACESSARTLKVAGPEPAAKPPVGVEEVIAPEPRKKPSR